MEEYIKKSDLIEEFTKRQQSWEDAADSTIVDDFAHEYKGIARAYKNACTIIELMPPTNVVEVKRGEWVNLEMGYEDCSVCGYCFATFDEHDRYIERNFCPNCGADMRGKINEKW